MITKGEGSSPKRSATPMNCWSCVHKDILDAILQKLTYIDKLTTRAVCSNWRVVAKAHVSASVLKFKDPLLMIEERTDEPVEDCITGMWFYSIKEKKIHELNIKSREFKKARCVGSSYGWLIFTEDRGNFQTPFIYNPLLDVGIRPVSFSSVSLDQEYAKDVFLSVLTRGNIPLGVLGDDILSSLDKNNDLSDLPLIRNAILWGNPISSDDNNYGIVVTYGSSSKLAFAKCGDTSWSSLEGSSDGYCDVVSREKFVYAVTTTGSVQAWDFSGSSPSKVFDMKPSLNERVVEDALGTECRTRVPRPFYLVESMGKLWLVAMYTTFVGVPPGNRGAVSNTSFRFYELDFDESKWVEVGPLGDRVVFLGESQTTSLPASALPGYDEGVYRADDYFWGQDHEVARRGRNICVPRFWVIPSLI